MALLTLGNVGFYVNTSDILLLCFFCFFFEELFSVQSLSINLLRNLSQLSWNSLFAEQMWRRRKACENGMLCFNDSG